MRKKKKRQRALRDGHNVQQIQSLSETFVTEKTVDESVPKAYRPGAKEESSDESVHQPSDNEQDQNQEEPNSKDDSGLESNSDSESDKHENVQVSSLLSDMEKLKEELIKRNEYEKLKEKCRRSDSDDD